MDRKPFPEKLPAGQLLRLPAYMQFSWSGATSANGDPY